MSKYKVGDAVLFKSTVRQVECDTEHKILIEMDGGGWCLTKEDNIVDASKTYEHGLTDAWELAKKIALYDYETESGYTQSELKAIFNRTSLQGVFRSYTIQEALAKVEEVSKEEIKAGDFCIDEDGLEWLVTYVNKGTSKDDIDYHCMDKKGYTSPVLYHKGELNKTGKHLDISHLLEQIRGNE